MRIKKRNLLIFGIILGLIVIIGLIFALQKILYKPVPYPTVTSPRPILGNINAKVKVIEFSDLQCPACKAAAMYPQMLVNEFGNNISVEFKPFPLSFHQYAYKAAVGAECANDQGKFWDFVETCFTNQPNLAVNDLKNYAKQLGLNTTAFNSCIDGTTKDAFIDSSIRDGYSINIPGTPTFIVDGQMVDGISYDAISAKVQEEIDKNK